MVESTCRTILKERKIDFSQIDDLPKLFRKVRQHLPLLPPKASQAVEVRKSLTQTLDGLRTAVQGICELRNRCGFASHGYGGPQPQMGPAQAFLAAEAADTIVGFLYRIHQQDLLVPDSSFPKYEANPEFNDYVDENYSVVRIFDAEFRPSEILYQMEPESYYSYLSELESLVW